MHTRNITFNLPADLLKQVKVYAAQHDTTVNALVRQLLQEKLNAADPAVKAAEQLLALAERAPLFDGDPGEIRREELYERR